MDKCNIYVPSGVIGSGFPASELEAAMDLEPHAIALDGGSTDSGPAYLGSAQSKSSRDAVARDLRLLVSAAKRAGIPLIVGSCGTSGTDTGVDWMADILRSVAEEAGLDLKVGLIYSELSGDLVKAAISDGKVRPLAPLGDLTPETVDQCRHIVALCGAEPIAECVRDGCDVVLSGRTTDTAVIASVPLLHGFPAGAAWHAAKTAECGSQCAVISHAADALGGVMLTIDAGGFEVEPLNPQAVCTPYSVSAHMLYENSDPYLLFEPGGLLDARDARYRQKTDRVTRVTGSKWISDPVYTHKLEGAGSVGFQTAMIVGIRSPEVLADIDRWTRTLRQYLERRIADVYGQRAVCTSLSLRAYGWNGVNEITRDALTQVPQEVGVMLVVTAPDQDLADGIAKTCNPYLFHFPSDFAAPLPSYGFPFSPAEIRIGECFEFKLNHVLEVDRPDAVVRTRVVEITHAVQKGLTDA